MIKSVCHSRGLHFQWKRINSFVVDCGCIFFLDLSCIIDKIVNASHLERYLESTCSGRDGFGELEVMLYHISSLVKYYCKCLTSQLVQN